MSNFHPTPSHIVDVLRKHLPRNFKRVLEPSVGEGDLLGLVKGRFNEISEISLIDIDSKKINSLRALYPFSRAECCDFLAWHNEGDRFDLILTNPPFSARPESWIETVNGKEPIEISFLRKCLSLLENKGTLIAIVPDSVVCSQRFQNFRKEIFSSFSVRYCYKLPEKTFGVIEGAFYALVVKSDRYSSLVRLRKLCDGEISEISVSAPCLSGSSFRLDYDYYAGVKNIADLEDYVVAEGVGVSANSLSARRGPVRHGYKSEGLVHTTSFRNGFWIPFSASKNLDIDDYVVVCKRVSRAANLSFGLIQRKELSKCTDCLIIIESFDLDPMRLLFFLRVLYANDVGMSVLLKGAGAKFIPVSVFYDMKVYDISLIFPEEFECFSKKYLSLLIDEVLAIEDLVFNKIMLRDGVSFIREISSLVRPSSESDTLSRCKKAV